MKVLSRQFFSLPSPSSFRQTPRAWSAQQRDRVAAFSWCKIPCQRQLPDAKPTHFHSDWDSLQLTRVLCKYIFNSKIMEGSLLKMRQNAILLNENNYLWPYFVLMKFCCCKNVIWLQITFPKSEIFHSACNSSARAVFWVLCYLSL